jgi:Asp-tRNA(Asn)/Glu-tRNA(Gln) amidotransferase A subunit family amidase
MASADLELCYLTATEAVDQFKAKKLSPVELMKAVLARCEAVNPKLNVLTYTFAERALEHAKASEARYMKGEARPLEGVPLAIKDFHPVRGEITTFGSLVYKDFRPDNTAPTIERLFDAGAIMHCRTTTPEFAHSGVTKSRLWGVSRNPWNLEYTPGGSSGGAGAALAAGMTTIADGTDGGGSIRIPSSVNGVFGYKPPFGRNPLDREHPRETVLHYGPLARSVRDAALMQNVMSGPHSADICTVREKLELPQHFESIKGWKAALSMDLGYYEIDPEVRRNTLEAGEVFKSLGCQVEEVDLGWNYGVLDAWLTHWEGLFAGIASDLLPRWRYEMEPFVVHLLERGLGHSAARLYRCNLVAGDMYKTLAPILDKYSILICPTTAVPSVKAEHRDDDPDFTVNGKKTFAYVQWVLTYPFNMMSQCPVASIPSGTSSMGIPTGLQIVGRTFDDLSVFRAAAAFEAARPWRARRPSL